MQQLTECVLFHEAGNSRRKEQYSKNSDDHMFCFAHVECVEFSSQRKSGVVLMECTHGKRTGAVSEGENRCWHSCRDGRCKRTLRR